MTWKGKDPVIYIYVYKPKCAHKYFAEQNWLAELGDIRITWFKTFPRSLANSEN